MNEDLVIQPAGFWRRSFTFLLDLTTIPFIGSGAWLGIIIVKKIPERFYRWFIIATTLIAALFMLI